MVKNSQLGVVYTGAGISTGAGICDYASANAPKNKLANNQFRQAIPTKAHFVIAEMMKKDIMANWLQ